MAGGSGGGNAAAAGNASTNPYIAFRRRTEKMQTRKNRKNDETSYEKMLKLRRDLSRAIVLLVGFFCKLSFNQVSASILSNNHYSQNTRDSPVTRALSSLAI